MTLSYAQQNYLGQFKYEQLVNLSSVSIEVGVVNTIQSLAGYPSLYSMPGIQHICETRKAKLELCFF